MSAFRGRTAIALLAFGLVQGACTEAGVGPADDDSGADDDATPPDDDVTAVDDDAADDDGSPDDDSTVPVDDDVTGEAGCPDPPPPDCGDPDDRDCDGSPDAADCGPDDPYVHPGALEACGNAVDEDCDGTSLPCRRSGEVLLDLDDPEGFDAAFTCSTPLAYLGQIAAFLGDENGDGFGDIILQGGMAERTTCVLDGPFEGVIDLDLNPERCVASFDGVCGFGCIDEVAWTGDANGDGYDDVLLVVGTYWGEPLSRGGAALFLGPFTGEITPDDAVFTLRAEVLEDNPTMATITLTPDVAAGDVDGDGFLDVLAVDVTYPYDGMPSGITAKATVYLGELVGTRTWADADGYIYDAGVANDVGGYGDLTDLDGDGVAEIRLIGGVGEESWDYQQAILSFSSFEAGDRLVNAADQEWVCDEPEGACFGGGDFLPWVPPSENRGCGAAWAWNGFAFDYLGKIYQFAGLDEGRTMLSAIPEHVDGSPDWLAGLENAGGDVNGDGWADLVTASSGNPAYDTGGAATVVLGPISGTVSTDSAYVHYHGQGEPSVYSGGAGVGGDVDAMDVNGDGYDDLLIVAPGYDRTFTDECNDDYFPIGPGGCREGAVFLVLGGP